MDTMIFFSKHVSRNIQYSHRLRCENGGNGLMYKWVKKNHFLSMHCLLSKKTPKSIIKPRVNPLVSLCLKWRNEFCRVVTIAPQIRHTCTINCYVYVMPFFRAVVGKKTGWYYFSRSYISLLQKIKLFDILFNTWISPPC